MDDRLRGKLPLEKPLRVSVGSRAIRVEKEGFTSLRTTVEVKAGKESVAELAAQSRKARLVVSEKSNEEQEDRGGVRLRRGGGGA
ncbi:PEGA domain-containing protein [Sorangium sp. So ce327]|uniref:PEGA domain-containing protein n=1 Tax=Sorangium sp. So ce327 TaxID=3133301 RepID=UPI003F645933